MGAPKENPDPVAAGSGVESKPSTIAANCNAWHRWTSFASVERMSARQRRAVRLMAARLAATPERAFRALDGRCD